MNYWRIENGELVKISNMATSHIINCIDMIKEKHWRLDYLPVLETELRKRKLCVGMGMDL